MNVVQVMQEILFITNPMVGESALPDLSFSPKNCSEGMRVTAFDNLRRMLKRCVLGRSQKQVHVLGHENEAVQFITAFPPVSVEGSETQPNERLNYEQSATLPCRKRHEISTGRGNQSSGLQSKPQRLEAAPFAKARSARVELVPLPVGFSPPRVQFGKGS